MLVALVGLSGSGKHSLATYLTAEYGFMRIEITDSQEYDGTVFNAKSNSINPTIAFESAAAALAFVTANWRAHYVVPDLYKLAIRDKTFAWPEWRKRPFLLMIALHGEALVRFDRISATDSSLGLHTFIGNDDAFLYHKRINNPDSLTLSYFIHAANLTIENSFPTLEQFYARVAAANILSDHRLRPSWDLYFMHLCELAAMRSNCMKRRVGCVVAKNRRVIATGYNGTPMGLKNCNEGGCKRCNDAIATQGTSLEMCICLHAEENALLEAGRERISGNGNGESRKGGAILYCNTCPCLQCTRKIIQVGISEVVYALSYGAMDAMSKRLFEDAGVTSQNCLKMSFGHLLTAAVTVVAVAAAPIPKGVSSLMDMNMGSSLSSTSNSTLCGSMYLHSAICDSVLFAEFVPANGGQYLGALLFTLVLSVFAVFADKTKRSLIQNRIIFVTQNHSKSLPPTSNGSNSDNNDNNKNDNNKNKTSKLSTIFSKLRISKNDPTRLWHLIAKTGLTFLSVLVRYIVMLIVMTFNIGLILAACLGFAIGSLLFEDVDIEIYYSDDGTGDTPLLKPPVSEFQCCV
ncbi:Deoxycytidine monophosphate (dCMP) deaminase [Physocladia obscura]|uniref:Deoxycytidylate deaminase n=1 Tax=Physocladia obscura TaxID=109957 RepID=A0AAD5T8H4_9FUNG|nr:Deoxycytidine monophosphate (dCMP) deaminase [Physocladia obscura]